VKAKIDNVKAKIQDKEEKGPWSRPTLARRPVFGQLAASSTSSPLEGPPREVSASHKKSPPHTRSSAPTGTWAQTRGISTPTDARGRMILHFLRVQQLAAIQAARPDKSLNVVLTGYADITSPSSPTLLHASSAQGTQAPLYDAHKPRLRLGCGRLGKCSDRLRQVRTTRRRSQAPRNEHSSPATRRLPRQSATSPRLSFNAPRQTTTYDGTCQLPSTVSFLLPHYAPLLVTIKVRGGQQLQGLDLRKTEHHLKGLGLDTLSRPACNPYYKHS
jgi:hypothetical protein